MLAAQYESQKEKTGGQTEATVTAKVAVAQTARLTLTHVSSMQVEGFETESDLHHDMMLHITRDNLWGTHAFS